MIEIDSSESGKFPSGWWQRRQARIARLSAELSSAGNPHFTSWKPFALLLAFALIGTFASGFLTYRHVLLSSNSGVVGESALCRANASINCDAILKSDYSLVYGFIPSAFLGLMGFAFVLWMVLNGLLNPRTRKIVWALLVFYFFAAIAFSWYYAYLMAFEVDFICTWCIVVHLVNLASLIIVLVVAIRNRKRFLLRESSTRAERAYLVAGGMLFAFLVFAAASLWEKALSFQDVKTQFEDLANDSLVIMAVVKGSPDVTIPILPDDPVYGSPQAPHPIIFFSDFQCPICKQTEGFLKTLVDKNPRVLKLVFKNFPLSKPCNTTVAVDLHPKSCNAAQAAYAAYLMGGQPKFWAFADLLMKRKKRVNDAILKEFAAEVKLDETKFAELMQPDSPAAQKVAGDVKLGVNLGLNATPQIFFERKRIPEIFKGEFLVDAMRGLISDNYPEKKDIKLTW